MSDAHSNRFLDDISHHSSSAHEHVLWVQQLSHGQGLELPHYATIGSAGLDLRAALPEGEDLILFPGKRILIPTGLILHLTAGYEAQIRPRSGLALKHGITCLNTPGTIDSDYRGEVKVLLINLGEEDFPIQRGMRIAQMVISPITQVEVRTLEENSEENVPASSQSACTNNRGTGGFGSTGQS
ncbi:dUTP diphosphatase [Bartonella ancashensis]|uniref:Deoxyuridine 5'-triphosphate nucleotidohydrolase n=1 Tax=Bartonella ancashensis TaxID=1318743 RepID=A0A0M4LIW5_9HYPH|nr:dUTP diphosphatase [Bartonella ancashensis]ALE03102.1 Deoxyuridine 5'-triphosphate nucleotidohydrolase [Bartonella ancashensis]